MFQKLKIQKKMFVTVSVFFLISMVTIVFGFCSYIYRENIAQEETNFIQTGELIKERLQSIVENMDAISGQIVGNAAIQEEVAKAYHFAEKDGNYFDDHVEARRRIRQECAALNISRNSVDQIYIYRQPNIFLSYTTDVTDEQNVMEFLNGEEWEAMCRLEENQYYRMLMPHKSPWAQGDEQLVVSLIRPLVTTYSTKEEVAFIEVTKKYQELETACSLPDQTEEKEIIVLDLDSGEVVFPYEEIPDARKEHYLRLLEEGEKSFRQIKNLEGKKELIYSGMLENCNWCVLIQEPYESYLKPVYKKFIFIGILCVIFLAFVLIAISIISSRLTRPIIELREALKDVSLDHLEISAVEDTNNEVELLRESFQKLLVALQKSSNSLVQSRTAEYQAKLIALQSAINPHFLYNSIMAIGAAGQEANAEKVERMCVELSQLFRYASEVREQTSLAEELEDLKIYLEFMSWRYLDELEFSVEITGDPGKLVVPRLILQPIVENCFTHGFHTARPPHRIRVNCRAEEKGWTIEIKDNGGGFSREALEELERIRRDVDLDIRENRCGAFELHDKAIMNVYARMRLVYHERAVFLVKNEEEQGACVTVGCMPEQKEEV